MEWISIREKMPPEGKPVLLLQTYPEGTAFHCRADPLSRCFVYVGGIRSYDKFFVSRDKQHDPKGLVYITHWMPLPEKPNEMD